MWDTLLLVSLYHSIVGSTKHSQVADEVRLFASSVLFPRHFQNAEVMFQTVSQIQLFRDYLHYHSESPRLSSRSVLFLLRNTDCALGISSSQVQQGIHAIADAAPSRRVHQGAQPRQTRAGR